MNIITIIIGDSLKCLMSVLLMTTDGFTNPLITPNKNTKNRQLTIRATQPNEAEKISSHRNAPRQSSFLYVFLIACFNHIENCPLFTLSVVS
jgi:hypothetical protein